MTKGKLCTNWCASDKLKCHRSLWLIVLSFIIYHLSFVTASAQSFTQRIQQNMVAGARITIHQDNAITELVNGKPVTTTTTTTPRQNNDRPRQNRQNSQNGNSQNGNSQQPGSTENTETATTTEPSQNTDSVTVAPRRTRKAAGFRVQPFVGGNSRADRVKAEQTGATLQTLFPGHRVYVHFLGGKWTCRLGDFRTITEAKEVLDELVKMGYDRAILVRGKINVPY